MERIKLIDSEAFETKNVFNFEEGEVTIVEREVHEFYAFDRPAGTRLIIDNAIEKTRTFIAKSRSDMAELNSVLQELTVK
jgi:hypothetical protein